MITMTTTMIPNATVEAPVSEPNTITFNLKDNIVLKLDQQGFHYNGQLIEDAGTAYDMFTSWLEKANRAAE